MTEEEWLSCVDASRMVDAMVGQASHRKIRLFAVACCRHLGRLPTSPEFFQALESAERFVDGKPNKAALRRARQAVRSVRYHPPIEREGAEEWAALWLAEVAATENAAHRVAGEIDQFVWRGPITEAGRPPGPALARCIFGNPYRIPQVRAEELPPMVVDLARSIDQDRAFDRLPILADALEDAGCSDPAILAHCREPGVHAKGCWVVDLILGK